MSLAMDPIAVPLKKASDGAIRVGDSRVLLEVVLFEFNHGATPEELVQNYATLKLADVYAVISYYLNQKELFDAYVSERQRQGGGLRRTIEAAQGDLGGIRERLLARRA